jgi:Zn finger protein HypA/HybF involved in hydrogenase expression
MLENLAIIKNEGIEALLAREEEKWKCQDCGGVISCHNGVCYTCGGERLKNANRP